MEQPTHPTIADCADDLRSLYPSARRQFIIVLWCIGICGPLFLLGSLIGMEWIGGFGIALCGGLFVVPHVMRIRRFLASVPCASCSQPAGRHTTVNGVVHLQCCHCGSVTRTDCLMLGSGKPTRI